MQEQERELSRESSAPEASVLVQRNVVQKIKLGPKKICIQKNFGQNWVSNSWDIPDMDKCRQDKCCLDKCNHESVLDVPRNLHLKFHQNWVSNSWDIADIEFVWVGGGSGGVKSFSCKTQPLCSG